jgi:hypothetical protein
VSGAELVYEHAMKAIAKMPDGPQKTAAIENAERRLTAAQFEEKHDRAAAAVAEKRKGRRRRSKAA